MQLEQIFKYVCWALGFRKPFQLSESPKNHFYRSYDHKLTFTRITWGTVARMIKSRTLMLFSDISGPKAQFMRRSPTRLNNSGPPWHFKKSCPMLTSFLRLSRALRKMVYMPIHETSIFPSYNESPDKK